MPSSSRFPDFHLRCPDKIVRPAYKDHDDKKYGGTGTKCFVVVGPIVVKGITTFEAKAFFPDPPNDCFVRSVEQKLERAL